MHCSDISDTSVFDKLIPTMKTKRHIELPLDNWSLSIGVNIGSENQSMEQTKNNLKNETQYDKHYGSFQKLISEESDVAKNESKSEKPCRFSQNFFFEESDDEDSEYIGLLPYSLRSDIVLYVAKL